MPAFAFNAPGSFTDLSFDQANGDAINTDEYRAAAKHLVELFNVLGPWVFSVVIKDMNGNIGKIEARQKATPTESTTLQALMTNELKAKEHTATEGILWLNRGFDFTAQALRHNLAHPDKELVDSFQIAYANTLEKHHNGVAKAAFGFAMKGVPYKKKFYAKLGDDQGKVNATLEPWLNNLEKSVKVLNEFLAKPENQWK